MIGVLINNEDPDQDWHSMSTYRSRATNGRSQLVAIPLSLQATTHFLCVFYVVIWTQK